NLITGNRPTPVFLDVPGHHIIPRKVIDIWFAARVVHTVGHVTDQDYVLSLSDHLTNRKWPAQDAHILLNSHYHFTGYPCLTPQIVSFRSVGDRAPFLDLYRLNFSFPRRAVLAPRLVITAAVRIIDR